MRTFIERLELELEDSKSFVDVSIYHADTDEEANELLDILEKYLEHIYVLGFDTETTGLHPESANEVLRLYQFSIRLGADYFEAFTFDDWIISDFTKERIEVILSSTKITKVGHNLMFDIKFAKKALNLSMRFGRLFCTFQASAMLTFGAIRNFQHSLKAVASRFCGLLLDKTEQRSDWSKPQLDDEQVKYAGVDAVAPVLVFERMMPLLEQERLVFASQNVFEAVEPAAKLEYDGIYIDEALWRYEANKTLEKLEEVSNQIYELLPSNQGTLFDDNKAFNIRSNELNKRLALAGVELPRTEKGNETRNKHYLAEIADEHPVIPLLLKHSELDNRASSYGLGVLKDVNFTTKRIHPSLYLLAAATSRMSMRDPNLQKIPREDNLRSCFKAEKGNKLIIADYSQIELRILTHESKDDVFAQGFLLGKDFHRLTASLVFEVAFEDVTDEQRQFAKSLNFMLVYGGGAHKLSAMTGLSLEESEEIIEQYFNTYKRTRTYLERAARNAVKFKQCRTMAGHLLKLRFDRTDKKMKSRVERIGKNMRIQGTSADIARRAARLLFDYGCERNIQYKFCNIVHDELIIEVEERLVDEGSALLTDAMMDAGKEYITYVPVKVDVHVSDVWKK